MRYTYVGNYTRKRRRRATARTRIKSDKVRKLLERPKTDRLIYSVPVIDDNPIRRVG